MSAFIYWCPKPDCRKKLYYKVEETTQGVGNMQRVRQNERSAFAARLKQAKESDWVWGFDPTTYQKVKRFVR